MAAEQSPTKLRRRAETLAKEKSSLSEAEIASLTSAEIKQTLHELKVHQIELEMQNDELQQAQNALAESRDRYFDLYDLAPVGYLTLSHSGIIQKANLAAATMLGVVRKNLIDSPFTLLVVRDDLPIHLHHFRRLFEIDQPRHYDLRLKKGGDLHFWVTVKASNNIAQSTVRLVISDITSRKQAEGKLAASNKELEETVANLEQLQKQVMKQRHLAAVGQLSAGVAHDFNNILAVISLQAEMNLETNNVSEIHRRGKVILKQVDHASHLVQQILDFSQKAMLRLKLFELTPFLEDIVEMLKRTIPENIEISLDTEPGCTVQADQGHLRQLLLNLALNSMDAMPAGGTLSIQAVKRWHQAGKPTPYSELPGGNWVQITVADTGTGIPKDVLPHIFEPFFTTKEVGKGSGLGLAQAHGIVKQHKGYIDVQSQGEVGTKIIIHLPVATAQPQATAHRRIENEVPDGEGEVVLIVEDNSVLRETLVKVIGAMNYRTYGAADGIEALSTLEAHPEIDVVLSDMMMPRMGGAELLSALKKKNLNVPMIGMTGYSLGPDQIQHLIDQGLQGCIIKPPDLRELKIFLNRAVGRKSH